MAISIELMRQRITAAVDFLVKMKNTDFNLSKPNARVADYNGAADQELAWGIYHTINLVSLLTDMVQERQTLANDVAALHARHNLLIERITALAERVDNVDSQGKIPKHLKSLNARYAGACRRQSEMSVRINRQATSVDEIDKRLAFLETAILEDAKGWNEHRVKSRIAEARAAYQSATDALLDAIKAAESSGVDIGNEERPRAVRRPRGEEEKEC